MRAALIFILFGAQAQADSLVATRLIAAKSLVTAADFTSVAADIPDALTDPAMAIGQQALVMITPGRALRTTDLGPPIVVSRNQTVTLRYASGPLVVDVAGRALGPGAVGQAIKVLNLSSKTTVTGTIAPDQTVYVMSKVP